MSTSNSLPAVEFVTGFFTLQSLLANIPTAVLSAISLVAFSLSSVYGIISLSSAVGASGIGLAAGSAGCVATFREDESRKRLWHILACICHLVAAGGHGVAIAFFWLDGAITLATPSLLMGMFILNFIAGSLCLGAAVAHLFGAHYRRNSVSDTVAVVAAIDTTTVAKTLGGYY